MEESIQAGRPARRKATGQTRKAARKAAATNQKGESTGREAARATSNRRKRRSNREGQAASLFEQSSHSEPVIWKTGFFPIINQTGIV